MMSLIAKPPCQNAIVTSSRSRPGKRPGQRLRTSYGE
jgi:hypothetical protein